MDIVFTSGIEWYGQNHMPCHHLVEGLAKQHRVFYINNFGAIRDLDHHDFSLCLLRRLGYPRGDRKHYVVEQLVGVRKTLFR